MLAHLWCLVELLFIHKHTVLELEIEPIRLLYLIVELYRLLLAKLLKMLFLQSLTT